MALCTVPLVSIRPPKVALLPALKITSPARITLSPKVCEVVVVTFPPSVVVPPASVVTLVRAWAAPMAPEKLLSPALLMVRVRAALASESMLANCIVPPDSLMNCVSWCSVIACAIVWPVCVRTMNGALTEASPSVSVMAPVLESVSWPRALAAKAPSEPFRLTVGASSVNAKNWLLALSIVPVT